MTWKDAILDVNSNPKEDYSTIAYYLNEYAREYGLNTELAQAYFLANFLHETDGLNSLKEYADGSQYEGREDLGNTQPGDGKKFKGRGGFMVTGRANYKDVSRRIFKDDRLLDHPDLLEIPKYAVLSSLYYWKSRGLTEMANKKDFNGVVKRINGGYNGLEDRKKKLSTILDSMDGATFGAGNLGTFFAILVIAASIAYYVYYVR